MRDNLGKISSGLILHFSAVLVWSESLLSHIVGFGGTPLLFVSLDTLCHYVG